MLIVQVEVNWEMEKEPKRGMECNKSITGYHDLVFSRVSHPANQVSEWVCKYCFAVIYKKFGEKK